MGEFGVTLPPPLLHKNKTSGKGKRGGDKIARNPKNFISTIIPSPLVKNFLCASELNLVYFAKNVQEAVCKREKYILYKYCMEWWFLAHHNKNKNSLNVGHFLVHCSLQSLHSNYDLSFDHSHTHSLS